MLNEDNGPALCKSCQGPIEEMTIEDIWQELARRFETTVLIIHTGDDVHEAMRMQRRGSVYKLIGMLGVAQELVAADLTNMPSHPVLGSADEDDDEFDDDLEDDDERTDE